VPLLFAAALLGVVGTIPVIIVGGLFVDAIAADTRMPQAAAVTLAVGAILFLVWERHRVQSRQTVGG
jgi:undecaprenyl pyrophosphate phosphatase UppP